MGFLSNLFKKKKGGTKVGNFLRTFSSTLTNGAIGNGSELTKWEQKQAIKQAPIQNTLATTLANEVQPIYNAVVNSQEANEVKQNLLMQSLKQNWYFIVAGIAGIFGISYLIFKRR